MKILFINNAFPTEARPERATYAREIMNCLAMAGHNVDKIVRNIGSKSWVDKCRNYLNFYFRLLLAQYKKYDAVYVNHYPFCFLPLVFHRKGIQKLFIHWHGMDLIPQSITKKIYYTMAYRSIPESAVHIVPSEYLKEILQKNIAVPDENIYVSPSGGIDTTTFYQKRTPENSKKRIDLGYASALDKNKGADLIAMLYNDLKDLEADTGKKVVLHCIEYGKDKKYYLDRLKKSENLIIHKPYTKAAIPAFYHKIDILLFPTLNESLGLVGLEAMSCNVPVVGTDEFALKEYIVPKRSGERFTKSNYPSFIKAIRRTMKNIALYEPRKIVVEKYSRESVVRQYKTML